MPPLRRPAAVCGHIGPADAALLLTTPPAENCELLLEAPGLYCPSREGLLRPSGGASVAIHGGRIVWAGAAASCPSTLRFRAVVHRRFGSAALLCPGLIDLHCHCDPTGGQISRYGLHPDGEAGLSHRNCRGVA